ncbi:hypothetical protein BH11PSE11_BH11PSE11_06660 [soil metagenome]
MTLNRNAVLPGFLVVGLLVFYPALSSYFFTDDFGFLAISRYIHNPLSFFTNDHFPGGLYYRPFGLFSWWVTYKLFGTQHELHNLANLLIHVGSTCVLFRIFCLIRDNMRLNILVALLFLVHPLTISTSMWLSDRFDLLATLLILLTIYWYLHYRLDGARHAYFFALSACILASLSKELAYFAPLLVTISAWFGNRITAQTWRARLFEIAPFYAAVLFIFVVRFILLRGAETNLLGEHSLYTVLIGGIGQWCRLLPTYYSSYTDFANWNTGVGILLLLSIAVLAGLSLRAVFKQRTVNWNVLLLGLTIVFVPAILQAPVSFTGLNHNPGGGFDYSNMAGSRFYYLSLVGFLLVVHQFLTAACSMSGTANSNLAVSKLVYSLLALQILAYGVLSHSLGIGWAQLSNGPDRQVAEQTRAALEHQTWPEQGCKLYILNTPSTRYFREFSDVIVKAIAPQGSRIIHCLVLTEKSPWFQLMLREDEKTMQIAPLLNATVAGHAFVPTYIGNLAFFYLNVPGTPDVAFDQNAVFIEFDGKKYIDVTREIRSGSRKVQFFSARP